MVSKARWYPKPAPFLPGEDPAHYMFRLLDPKDNPYNHVRSYFCSLAEHNFCTKTYGDDCECPCHWDQLVNDDPEESDD